MVESAQIALVKTIKDRCRVCYTCVRECPAKAIRIADGKAEVIVDRCIGCGNCVRVCGQQAKLVYESIGRVHELLATGDRVVAMVAPSFPAEFGDWDSASLVGVLRSLGFRYVVEVAVGADLVAEQYRRLLERDDDSRYIATTCPAVVSYIQRYYPELVPKLAPVVSPMVATARVVRHLYGDDVRVVFIGPCIAKKGEAFSECVPGEVDAALTFIELRNLAQERGVWPEKVPPGDFDPPQAGSGSLFPLSRGLLQAAGMPENLALDEVVTADGRISFVEAIKEYHAGHWQPRLLDVQACEGCIAGPGIGNNDPIFRRRSRVSRYVRERLINLDAAQWQRQLDALMEQVDLSRGYVVEDRRTPNPSPEELDAILRRMGKESLEDELNCGACGYDTCREHANAIHKGLAQSEMCLPYTIDKLRETVKNLAVSKGQLARTQEILMQTEKLASMGQLAAGIAHELNNPLGVVLMYAHMLLDEHAEDLQMREDLELVAAQADRCKKIVSGLLHFARQNRVTLQETDIRVLTESALKVMDIPPSVSVHVEHEPGDQFAELDPDQVMQVLINLIGNACQAMPDGGLLTLRTGGDDDEVTLTVVDTGTGIPKDNLSKIFEPFFTTKTSGKGTGMGLAVSYGIVKMHRGNIQVTSNTDRAVGPTGTTFSVQLPRRNPSQEPA
jgi:signal transduction histidine kinase/Fe-S-cluster-containing hydrogenase component 2